MGWGQTPCFAAEIGIPARKGYAKDGVSLSQLPNKGQWDESVKYMHYGLVLSAGLIGVTR